MARLCCKMFRYVVFICLAVGTPRSSLAAQVNPSSALPVFIFQTAGQAVHDRTRVSGFLTILDSDLAAPGGFTPSDASGRAELSARGNSSFYYAKKSYRLELQSEQGRDRKAPLLGMPTDSDWVLYASVTDRTFARNLLGHELWRSTGRYAVRWRFVELFVITNTPPAPVVTRELAGKELVPVLNAMTLTNPAAAALNFSNAHNTVAFTLAGSYRGVYVLMEKLKRGRDRVDNKRLRPEHTQEPEISGGYIIKKDDKGRGQRGLLTGQEFRLRYEEPAESELTSTQMKWMAKYLDDYEKALFSQSFRDPANGYRKFIEMDSFVDFHWLVEIAKNADGFLFSQYMHKDRGGKLTMGPVWDWDNAFGNPHFQGQQTNRWRFESAAELDYTWYRRLFEDPDFLQRYMDRWSEWRTNVLATSNVLALVDRIASVPLPAQQRNALLWEREGVHASQRAQAGVSYKDEVTALKEWLTGRLAWIDSQDYPKPVAQVLPPSQEGPRRLALVWITGRAFYTVDGSDPRAPGGGVVTTAIEYTAPVPVTTNTRITARVRSNFGLWSSPTRVTISAP